MLCVEHIYKPNCLNYQASVTVADDVALRNSDLQLVEELPASGGDTTSINLLKEDAVQIVTDVQRPPENNPEVFIYFACMIC